MTDPRNGPRHRSWASDTIITGVLLALVLIMTVVVDQLNGPAPAPAYLTGLLGAAATAFFAAAGSDKNKRDAEIAADTAIAKSRASSINETAIRGEAKADQISELLKRDRPDLADQLPDSLLENGGTTGGDPT